MAFPIDWNEWRKEWLDWRSTQTFNASSVEFGKKNMMADDILGIYDINGVAVELSEVTFTDFGSGSMENKFRQIGITWQHGINGGLVESFEELTDALNAGPPEKEV